MTNYIPCSNRQIESQDGTRVGGLLGPVGNETVARPRLLLGRAEVGQEQGRRGDEGARDDGRGQLLEGAAHDCLDEVR